MPLINQTFEYLPDIDAEIPDPILSSIKAQLQSSVPSDAATTLHPSLAAARTPQFSPLIQAEHKRIASAPASKIKAIDTSRYETLSAPDDGSEESWRATLNRAYTAHTYLSIRRTNLELLDEYGKNAWLIANAGLESELAKLEEELAEARVQAQGVENERRDAREAVKAEFQILGESWRVGIGRALETEIAAEDLRRSVLEQRKAGAGTVAVADGG